MAGLLASLCETDSPGTGESVSQRESSGPAGPEGESLAMARNISGCRKVLSPTRCGGSPLAEGAKGMLRHHYIPFRSALYSISALAWLMPLTSSRSEMEAALTAATVLKCASSAALVFSPTPGMAVRVAA